MSIYLQLIWHAAIGFTVHISGNQIRTRRVVVNHLIGFQVAAIHPLWLAAPPSQIERERRAINGHEKVPLHSLDGWTDYCDVYWWNCCLLFYFAAPTNPLALVHRMNEQWLTDCINYSLDDGAFAKCHSLAGPPSSVGLRRDRWLTIGDCWSFIIIASPAI